MRRILAFTLCLFCFLCFGGASVIAETEVTTYAFVNNPDPADRLNLRTEPRQNADSLGKYYNGVCVQVLEEDADSSWVRVRIGMLEGYMMKQYLTSAAGENVNSAMPTYISLSSGWELYHTRNTNGAYSMHGLGEMVTLLGFSTGWWHVQAGNEIGFVPAGFASFEQLSGSYYDGFPIAVINNPNPNDRLNLRVAARQNSTSLGKYYNGCIVAVLKSGENGWSKVRIGNLEGYMMEKYLEMDTPSSVASAQPSIEIRNANGTGLNLRCEPNLNADSLGLYMNGTKLTVMGLSDKWCHVCIDGKTGFMLLSGFDGQIEYNHNAENRKVAVVLYNTSMYSSTNFVYENQITTLPPGERVDVLETNAEWTKVSNGIRTGYVQTSALSIE